MTPELIDLLFTQATELVAFITLAIAGLMGVHASLRILTARTLNPKGTK